MTRLLPTPFRSHPELLLALAALGCRDGCAGTSVNHLQSDGPKLAVQQKGEELEALGAYAWGVSDPSGVGVRLAGRDVARAGLVYLGSQPDLDWLQELLIEIRDIDEETLRSLPAVYRLRKLAVWGPWSGSPNSAFEFIARMRETAELEIREIPVTESDLRQLEDPSRLRSLRVTHPTFGPEAGETLREFSNLRTLEFSGPAVSDSALSIVPSVPQVCRLVLDNTAISDEGMRHLRGATNLRSLVIRRMQITDAGLDHIVVLSDLEELTIWETLASDRIMRSIGNMSGLQRLTIGSDKLSDSGFVHLKNLHNLVELRLGAPGISATAERQLRDSLPKTKVVRCNY